MLHELIIGNYLGKDSQIDLTTDTLAIFASLHLHNFEKISKNKFFSISV